MRNRLRNLAVESWQANGALYVLVLVYFLCAAWVSARFGFSIQVQPLPMLQLAAAAYAVPLGLLVLWSLATERPREPIRHLRAKSADWRLGERMRVGLPALLLLSLFLSAFSSLKASIPMMSRYTLDPLFARLDVDIHGRDAWEVLQPWLGHPAITRALNWTYQFWLIAWYAVMALATVWIGRPQLRKQFLVAFVLCWSLLGNVAATYLASVGPCFYAHFYGQDRYAGLFRYLQAVDQGHQLQALYVQRILISAYERGGLTIGQGISAMPSVHVAIATLLAIVGWNVSRPWGVGATAFLVLIGLGSVHLGWHYAVDGYASLVATLSIWWASGWIVRSRMHSAAALTAPT